MRYPVPDYAFPAPDTYYGVSKAAGEALAAWLSADDAGRLFEACLTAPSPGFRVVFGVSANTRGGWVSLAEARALGYEPRDDAEAYAAEVIPATGELDPADPAARYLGGEFTLPALDADKLR